MSVQLGLRQNAAQFSLLVVVNAFVGAMVGMERSILPMIAEDEFALKARTAVLSFILMFGLTKAVTNFFAAHYGLRQQPFFLGIGFVGTGRLLSIFFVRENALARGARVHSLFFCPSDVDAKRE
jgi:hypothetical protein